MMRYIFLTHNLDDVDRIQLHKLFSELMFSVEPCYSKKASRYANIRRVLGLDNRVAYDSGGFAFLLGRIKEPPNPRRICQIYRLLGYTDNDFSITCLRSIGSS